MIEQSRQSNTASPTGGPASSSQTDAAGSQGEPESQTEPSRASFRNPRAKRAASEWPDHSAWWAEREARIARDRRALIVSKCGLPPLHMERQVRTHPEWSSKLATLRSMLGTGFIVALLGIRGTGKTQMAVELARDVINADKWARYVRVRDLMLRIRRGFQPDGEKEADIIAPLLACRLLILDEAHERAESDAETVAMANIIDHRYAAKRDCLIISNHEPDRFRESVGTSIYERIVERGGVIVCDWPSFRSGK